MDWKERLQKFSPAGLGDWLKVSETDVRAILAHIEELEKAKKCDEALWKLTKGFCKVWTEHGSYPGWCGHVKRHQPQTPEPRPECFSAECPRLAEYLAEIAAQPKKDTEGETHE